MKNVYPFPKTCPCCDKVYTQAAWDKLARLGKLTEMPWGEVCEYKNCECGTTMMQSYTEDGTLQPNPPWIDSILKTHWDRILARAKSPKMMPTCERGKGGAIKVCQQFGDPGHYGAVYPTSEPGVVFKVTSDVTEAMFVQTALEIAHEDKHWPDGLVKYYGVYRVPGVKHLNREVFVIWRQEAFHIGDLRHSSASLGPAQLARELDPNAVDYFVRSARQLSNRLNQFKEIAAKARALVRTAKDPYKRLAEAHAFGDWAWGQVSDEDLNEVRLDTRGTIFDRYRGAQALALCLQGCHVAAQMMENEYLGDAIGGALSYYHERDLLLADVHLQNVGLIPDEEGQGMHFAITDPGHAFSVKPEPWSVQIGDI